MHTQEGKMRLFYQATLCAVICKMLRCCAPDAAIRARRTTADANVFMLGGCAAGLRTRFKKGSFNRCGARKVPLCSLLHLVYSN